MVFFGLCFCLFLKGFDVFLKGLNLSVLLSW